MNGASNFRGGGIAREDQQCLASGLEQFQHGDMDGRSWARDLLATSELSLEKIWLSYFSVGGNAGPFELEAFIYGVDMLDAIDLMLLECALTDALPPDVAV